MNSLSIFDNKNIVIFGAAGFIGSNIIRYIKKKSNAAIYAYDLKNNESEDIFFCDVRKSINHIKFPSNIDLIINLAAVHREPGHASNEYYETNILGAENICKFANHVDCNNIIFTSSISPYGISDEVKNETCMTYPETPYGNSKLIAEKIHLCWANQDINKKSLIIVRPGVVFGKGENGNMSRLVRAIKGNYFRYTGNKSVPKAGIYIDELLRQISFVYEYQKNNPIEKQILFNSSIWPNPTIHDYVKSICRTLNKDRSFISIPYPLLMLAAYTLEGFSKIFRFPNFASPVRVRKLIKTNHIEPKRLIDLNYKPNLNLQDSMNHWQSIDMELWTK